MSFSDDYLNNLKYQQDLAESQSGGASASYENALEKARARVTSLNQEGDAWRQLGELAGLPVLHSGVKGLYDKAQQKAAKAIGDAGDSIVQRGKEYARQGLSKVAQRLGVSDEDIVNSRVGLKAPNLADRASAMANDAFNNVKSKIVARSGNAIGVEDPAETLKGLTDLDRAKTALSNKLNVNGQALQKQATRATQAVKSREQSLQDLAKRAERSQRQIRARANAITDQQEQARITQSAEDRLAKIRDMTSTPKQPAVKLDASDPEYLSRSRFQMPSADNDARLEFLKENNPRDFEDATNPFRFKNVMGGDASEVLGDYKASRGAYESRQAFNTRVANRARLARSGATEAKGVEVNDQLKPMRDFMKAKNTEMRSVSKLSDIDTNDVRAMEQSRFNQVRQGLMDRLGMTQQQQLAEAAAPQPAVEEEARTQPPLPDADNSQAEATRAENVNEFSNPSFDPHSVAGEHGEDQLDAQNDPRSLPNTSGQTAQATDTEGETLTQTTAPPSTADAGSGAVTGEDVGKALGKGAVDALETDAELGGPEDPLGDVAAAVVGLGTMLGSIFAPHQHEQVPAPQMPQLNPSLQLGVSG